MLPPFCCMSEAQLLVVVVFLLKVRKPLGIVFKSIIRKHSGRSRRSGSVPCSFFIRVVPKS
jgi:hypothetical protein